MRRVYHQPTNSEVVTTPQFATEYVLAPTDDDCGCYYIRPTNGEIVTATYYLTENDGDILTTNAGDKLTWT